MGIAASPENFNFRTARGPASRFASPHPDKRISSRLRALGPGKTAPRMWQERVDAFWDGKQGLALGFFDEENVAAEVVRPEIAVLASATEAMDDAELVDLVLPERWRSGCQVFELPHGRRFVALHAAGGAELRLELCDDKLGLVGGEWRLLFVELPDTGMQAAPAFDASSFPARGDLARHAQERIVRSGAQLVWALGQKRSLERSAGAIVVQRLEPAQRLFPAQQSHLAVEARELCEAREEAPPRAPFAILEHWLREGGAPCATLRLRFASFSQGDAFLKRASAFLVMQQRRAFRDWAREQRRLGEPIADPLTCDDIRVATGRQSERFDAVERSGPIVVHNLARLIGARNASPDGVSARRATEEPGPGAVVDLAFHGAALGDDLGLVSACPDGGDFEVLPADPGGVRHARVFRLGFDGLSPRAMQEDDPLLEEILRLAAEAERGAELGLPEAKRAAPLQERRERLIASLNRALAAAGYGERFDPTRKWDALDPLRFWSFCALVAQCPAAGRADVAARGGYEAFRADPALTEALAGQPDLRLADLGLRRAEEEAKPLVYRYAAVLGLAGVVAPRADAATQLEAYRLLRRTALARELAAARLSLDEPSFDAASLADTAATLSNEAMVERAVIYCDDWGFPEKGEALRAYLERRRGGEWTSALEGSHLAVIVAEADAYWREVGAARARPPEEAAPEKPAGLLAAVRGFFVRGASKAAQS